MVHDVVDRAFGVLPNPCALGHRVEDPERVCLGGPLAIERARMVQMPLWARVKACRLNGRLFSLTNGSCLASAVRTSKVCKTMFKPQIHRYLMSTVKAATRAVRSGHTTARYRHADMVQGNAGKRGTVCGKPGLGEMVAWLLKDNTRAPGSRSLRGSNQDREVYSDLDGLGS